MHKANINSMKSDRPEVRGGNFMERAGQVQGLLILIINLNTQRMQNAKVEPHITKRFDLLKKIGSGAYGHVWKVQEKTNKKVYALKKIFDAFQHATDAQRTYREVSILSQLSHDNIIQLKETIKAENQKDLYLVFEYMEADLHNVIGEGILKQVHSRYIVYQIAKALKYLHSAKLIHRDLKPSNVLLNSACLIKLCDFGLVRCIDADPDIQKNDVMTQNVATRWFRAPEVLLGSRTYGYPVDVWSFGCIIYEIYSKAPLFHGSSTLEQLEQIVAFTGYPSNQDISSLDSEYAKTVISEINRNGNEGSSADAALKTMPSGVTDLVRRMLQFNPRKRITIEEILAHQSIKDFRKPATETVCKTQIKTDLNDNKKLTVEEYKNSIYKSTSKSKSQSVSKLPFKTLFTLSKTISNKSNENLVKKDNYKDEVKVAKSSQNLKKGMISPTANMENRSKISKVFGLSKANIKLSQTKPVQAEKQRSKIIKDLSKTFAKKEFTYSKVRKLGDEARYTKSQKQFPN